MKIYEHEDSQFVLFVSSQEMKSIRHALKAAKEVYLDDKSRMRLLGTNGSFKVEALTVDELAKTITTAMNDHRRNYGS